MMAAPLASSSQQLLFIPYAFLTPPLSIGICIAPNLELVQQNPKRARNRRLSELRAVLCLDFFCGGWHALNYERHCALVIEKTFW